jgi:hypothetical protein
MSDEVEEADIDRGWGRPVLVPSACHTATRNKCFHCLQATDIVRWVVKYDRWCVS